MNEQIVKMLIFCTVLIFALVVMTFDRYQVSNDFGELSSSFTPNIFESVYLAHFFVGARRNLTSLGVWLIETYFPNFVNFGPGVPRYHAATCISSSLMHLSQCFNWKRKDKKLNVNKNVENVLHLRLNPPMTSCWKGLKMSFDRDWRPGKYVSK